MGMLSQMRRRKRLPGIRQRDAVRVFEKLG
jgi:hypothetical protein